MSILGPLKSLRLSLATLLAVMWVFLTCHCGLSAIPGFEFLRCDAESHESKDGGEPCKESSCCSLELAQFRSQRLEEVIPAVVVLILPDSTTDLAANPPPAGVSLSVPTAAPPDPSRAWQFLLRAALPPRAPSPA